MQGTSRVSHGLEPGSGYMTLPLIQDVQIVLVHWQSHLEADHKQAVRYDRRGGISLWIKRVFDERRQCLVNAQFVSTFIPASVQQDMRQPLMMGRRQFVSLPSNGIRSPLDVVQDTECALQISLFRWDNGRLRGEPGTLIRLRNVPPLRNILPRQALPLDLEVD